MGISRLKEVYGAYNDEDKLRKVSCWWLQMIVTDQDDEESGLSWGEDRVQSQEQRQTIWRRLNIFAQVSQTLGISFKFLSAAYYLETIRVFYEMI